MPAPRLQAPVSNRSNAPAAGSQSDPTWLKLVRTGRDLDGGSGVVVEGCAGVEDVIAGLDRDAAVAA